MLMVVVAIRDAAVEAFSAPQFVPSIGGALRSFKDAVNSKERPAQPLAAHPEDYDLFELGSYDDANAQFKLLDVPRVVARGKDLVEK